MHHPPQSLFDIYILSLPRGHGFGNSPPYEAWESEDRNACGIVTRNSDNGTFGVIVMRRRIDGVWTVISEQTGLESLVAGRDIAHRLMKEGEPQEPLPPRTKARAALHDLQGHQPTSIHKLLASPTHHRGVWLMNQLYLALPNPDPNWATDFHTGNFHTRMWELHLLGAFREQGLLVSQPHPSPDFRIENRNGGVGWVEAVTANPPEPYDHVNTKPRPAPAGIQELMLGPAAERFAKTIGSKLQRRYTDLAHVTGTPFAIALADFHAPASMVWSRNALIGYLYGIDIGSQESAGQPEYFLKRAGKLVGNAKMPIGLFCNEQHSELSAIIFTNTCTTAKFNRVAISAGALSENFRYTRIGAFFDRSPKAFKGIPFCLDVASEEYRALWPQGYEPWCADVEVFHNPFAQHPFPRQLLPEFTHWFQANGELGSEAHYETSILYSITLIQNKGDRILTLDDLGMLQ